MGVLVLVAAFAQVLSALAGQDAVSYDIGAINPPDGMPIGDFGGISGDHWLGVEPLTGRDVFARLVLALQFSLGLAVGVALVMVLLGLAVAVAVRRGNGRGLLGPALLYATLLVPLNLIVVVWFEYRGTGLRQPPEPSWGGMLSDAAMWFDADPAYLLVPGLLLATTVLSFLMLAEGLRRRAFA